MAVVIPALIQKRAGNLTIYHATQVLHFATISCLSNLAVAPMCTVWREEHNDEDDNSSGDASDSDEDDGDAGFWNPEHVNWEIANHPVLGPSTDDPPSSGGPEGSSAHRREMSDLKLMRMRLVEIRRKAKIWNARMVLTFALIGQVYQCLHNSIPHISFKLNRLYSNGRGRYTCSPLPPTTKSPAAAALA
jgi:hypothetical protein